MIKNPRLLLQKSIENAYGLTAYCKTLRIFDVDVSKDKNYQKNFTSYYRVRRDSKWLEKYYEFMEANKFNKDITFEIIIRYLSTLDHKVNKKVNANGYAPSIEASFASKMLATINPNYPIWDSIVVKSRGYKILAKNPEDKINEYIKFYNILTNDILNFINTSQGKECIRIFNNMFPDHKEISDVKKIDFYLWNLGK